MKRFSVHTGNCPDDCTHNRTIDEIIETYSLSFDDIDNLPIGEIFEINIDLNLMRDE